MEGMILFYFYFVSQEEHFCLIFQLLILIFNCIKINESLYIALFAVSRSLESFSQVILSIFTFLNQ